jgi:hypothetical protein
MFFCCSEKDRINKVTNTKKGGKSCLAADVANNSFNIAIALSENEIHWLNIIQFEGPKCLFE